MKTLKVPMLFLVCVGIAALMLTMQLSLIRELRTRSYVGPPLNGPAQVADAATATGGSIDHGSIGPVPERPRPAQGDGSALLAMPLLLVLLAVLAWSVGSTMARWDCGQLAELPLDPPPMLREDAVAYLVEGTRGRGDFVILRHAVEDLPQLSGEQLAAAVERARAKAPGLEHREVTGRWILRQPRIHPTA